MHNKEIDLIDYLDPLNIMNMRPEETLQNEASKKKRKDWVRPYYLERDRTGGFNCIFKELQKDPQLFYSYTRMDFAQFEELLIMIAPLIQKQTVVREPLSPNLRLAVTLRYLATGESQASLAIAYKCSPTSIHRIVTETTKAITAALKGIVLPKITAELSRRLPLDLKINRTFPTV